MTVPGAIRAFAQEFRRAGHELYVVGGAVRDSLLRRPVTDYDFATSATPAEVQALFRRTVPTGIAHGTVTVLYGDRQFEVTTYRVEGEYHDHRRPEHVHFTRSLQEDLSRRDFTINAIAYDPLTRSLIDPHDGRSDLKSETLRTVGDPGTRFEEDALRMLRAVRFAAVLQFAVAPELEAAIAPRVSHIAHVSVERVYQELSKMMEAPKPSRGWHLLRDTGLARIILPELLEDRTRGTSDEMPPVFEHLVASCDCAPRDTPVLRWAAMLHDIGKPRCLAHDARGLHFHGHDQVSADMAEEILTRLRAPKTVRDQVTHLVRHHMFDLTAEHGDAALRRFMSRVGKETVPQLLQLRRADICGKTGMVPVSEDLNRLERRLKDMTAAAPPVTTGDLAVNGRDLMRALSLSPGPQIGIVLEELLRTVIDDPQLNTRDQLLEVATRFYSERLRPDEGD